MEELTSDLPGEDDGQTMRGDFASRHGTAAQASICAFDEIVRSIAFAGTEPVLESIVPHVRDLLDGDQALAYRIDCRGDAMTLDFGYCSGLGPQARFQEMTASYLSASKGQVTGYRLPTPEPLERNAILLLASASEELKRRHWSAPITRNLIPKLGLADQDQIRVLICDGPHLLTWIGAFRLTPFSRAEGERLQRLVEPLRNRLKLEESLRRLSVRGAALDIAMDALGAPAFILDRRGDVVHANEAGRALASDERAAFVERGKKALAGRGPSDQGLSLLQIQAEGLPPHSLLLQRPGSSSEKRLVAFQRHWKLTQRQSQVLQQILEGKPNKVIGAILGIQEGTVELHVTSLFRKAGVESRSELVAAFWSQPHG